MAFKRPSAYLMSLSTARLDLAVFLVLGLINVNVDNGPVLAELIHLARDAVVETHAKGQEQIGARLDLDHRLVRDSCGARIRR